MSISSAAERQAPNANTLITRRYVGDILMWTGIVMFVIWVVPLAFGAIADWLGAEKVNPFPSVEWYQFAPLILLGYILASQSRKKLRYWHRYVRSGVIVDKDIQHYKEYSVDYVIYVKGETRAGNTYTYGHRMTHGQYEQKRIGDNISFSD